MVSEYRNTWVFEFRRPLNCFRGIFIALIGLSGRIKRDEKALHSKVISTDLDVVLRTFINLVSSKSSLEFTADLNRHLTK